MKPTLADTGYTWADVRAFLLGVVPSPGCLLWTGHLVNSGYGQVQLADHALLKSEVAHRVGYELGHGALTDRRMTVDHLCGVRLCVNPDHLHLKTRAANSRDGHRHVRSRRTLVVPAEFAHLAPANCGLTPRTDGTYTTEFGPQLSLWNGDGP